MGKILLLGVCVVVALILALIFFNQNQINSSAMSEVACDSYLYEQDFEDDNLIVVSQAEDALIPLIPFSPHNLFSTKSGSFGIIAVCLK